MPEQRAISESLNCTEGSPDIDSIRGAISGWVQIVAARYGLDPATDF